MKIIVTLVLIYQCLALFTREDLDLVISKDTINDIFLQINKSSKAKSLFISQSHQNINVVKQALILNNGFKRFVEQNINDEFDIISLEKLDLSLEEGSRIFDILKTSGKKVKNFSLAENKLFNCPNIDQRGTIESDCKLFYNSIKFTVKESIDLSSNIDYGYSTCSCYKYFLDKYSDNVRPLLIDAPLFYFIKEAEEKDYNPNIFKYIIETNNSNSDILKLNYFKNRVEKIYGKAKNEILHILSFLNDNQIYKKVIDFSDNKFIKASYYITEETINSLPSIEKIILNERDLEVLMLMKRAKINMKRNTQYCVKEINEIRCENI